MEVLKEQKVQHLTLASIKPDPKQPRKTFNEKSLQLLADNIAAIGVLQPITVRPSNKGHIIVMGERRFRASKLAKLKTIPCIVRDFESTIISEVQIIENLQRQQVEPIEEAEAITMLLEKYSADEISTRIGRTVQFIYGRIKLANLIEGFRVFVRTKEMTLSEAISVASFSQDEQKNILEPMEGRYNKYHISSSVNSKLSNLDKAPFDLKDEDLIPKAGSCFKCPFNTANQGNLFGEEKRLCTKSSCFTNKKHKSLLNLIGQVKKTGYLLIGDFGKYSYDRDINIQFFNILKEHGLSPISKDMVDYESKPDKPTLALITKQYENDDWTKDELKEEVDDEMQNYKEQLKDYNNASAAGFQQAILFNTSDYTSTMIIAQRKSETQHPISETSLAKKKMDQCTPSEKIEKINLREIRKKELENHKLFAEVVDRVTELDYINSKKSLSQDEMIAFTISMYENMTNYYTRSMHFDDFFGKGKSKDNLKILALFKKNYKKELFNKLVRMLLVQNLHFTENNHLSSITNTSVYTVFKDYFKKEVVGIEKSYDDTRKVREAKIKAKIKVLQEELEQLKA